MRAAADRYAEDSDSDGVCASDDGSGAACDDIWATVGHRAAWRDDHRASGGESRASVAGRRGNRSADFCSAGLVRRGYDRRPGVWGLNSG